MDVGRVFDNARQPIIDYAFLAHDYSVAMATEITDYYRTLKELSWELPGHGDRCDIDGFVFKACPGWKHWVRRKRSCFRARCPTHWRDWMNREAARIVRRVKSYVRKRQREGWRSIVQHVIVSVPDDWEIPRSNHVKSEQWGRIRSMLRECGVRGGAMVYHDRRVPTKFNDRFETEHNSPHWHVVGLGKINPEACKAIYDKYGIIIDGKGRAASLMAVCSYVLSHCAVPFNPALQQSKSNGYHTVTWWGCVSYSKFKAEKDENDDMCYCSGCRESYPWRDWHLLEWRCLDKPPPEAPWGGLCDNEWIVITIDRTAGFGRTERLQSYIRESL